MRVRSWVARLFLFNFHIHIVASLSFLFICEDTISSQATISSSAIVSVTISLLLFVVLNYFSIIVSREN